MKIFSSKIISPKVKNPGDGTEIRAEPDIKNFDFNIMKFSETPRPEDPNRILIICCFSEFGCEILGPMYCIPRILQDNPGRYVIAVGWYGRDYLYKHLVDEFWEIKEENMWLREYARAFHNDSKNLKNIEKNLGEYGNVVSSDQLGSYVVGARCHKCGAFWGATEVEPHCPECGEVNIEQSIFADVDAAREIAVEIPYPSEEKIELIKSYLKPNSVGIIARNRKCYGRNLQPEFYIKLIEHLEAAGYNPIWLGEKQSTLPCPVDGILDFSRMPESRDLETTLAIVSQLKFTIQFWTASTRISSIVGTPWILFESPDQIWGNGQEGYRLNLVSFSPGKLILSHYLNVLNNHDGAIEVIDKSIKELEVGNFEEVLGLLEDDTVVTAMKEDSQQRIGGSKWNITYQ